MSGLQRQTRGASWNAAGYVAARFAALAGLVADTLAHLDRGYDIRDCGRFFLVMSTSSVFITAYTDFMLILRLYYMYDCNRRLLWAAIGVFVGLSVVQGILNGRRETGSMSINPDGGACVSRTPLSEIPLLLWLAYNVLGAALALVKVGQARARDRLLWPRVSVLTLLARGNLVCYAVTIAGLCVPVVLAFRGQTDSVADAYYRIQRFTSVAFALLATSLFRAMRRMLARGGRDTTFGSVPPLATAVE